jgi:hypothetical protein
MSVASFKLAGRIAALSMGLLALGAPSQSSAQSWAQSLAKANQPRFLVWQDETILFPVPDCPKCLALVPGWYPTDHVFVADCICPD